MYLPMYLLCFATHIPLVIEGKEQLGNRCRKEIVSLAGGRKEL
jgi:hypothetical protein